MPLILADLLKMTDYDAKITNIEGKIPSIISLAITAVLTAVENKIPSVSDLVKKTDYDAKAKDIEEKYFNASNYNKLTSDTLDAKIENKKLVNEFVFSGFIKNTDLDKTIKN